MKIESPKYIFVIGGVMSSVGKGVSAGSIAAILQARGFKATNIKCDMYVNIDAGTIRPTEHGEVFVGADGIEADQDLGNYERFTGNTMTAVNYVTTGQVYQEVIRRERNLEYNGEDVEVVPDVPNEIIRRIKLAQQTDDADITVVEFGGTVGEYQLLLFLEAARMMKLQHPKDVAFVLVSYLPLPSHIGEMKTKPTQYAVRSLNAAGIQPDFIIARGETSIDAKRRHNLAYICNLPEEAIIAAPDAPSIYEVPLQYHQQMFDDLLLEKLDLASSVSNFDQWYTLSERRATARRPLKIGVIGKYFATGEFTLADSYISVIEAAKHAGWAHGAHPELSWIDGEQFEHNPASVAQLQNYDACIIPGGFGNRGTEGLVAALRYLREHEIPTLGICLGMQLMCVEFARNVLHLADASTTEINPHTPYPVVHANPYQMHNIRENRYGGTMRLGAYKASLREGSRLRQSHGCAVISERHRHRYELNNAYREQFEQAGMKLVGINPDTDLVEVVELQDHPFFVGVQYHPEFNSRPMQSHPAFYALIEEAFKKQQPVLNAVSRSIPSVI